MICTISRIRQEIKKELNKELKRSPTSGRCASETDQRDCSPRLVLTLVSGGSRNCWRLSKTPKAPIDCSDARERQLSRETLVTSAYSARVRPFAWTRACSTRGYLNRTEESVSLRVAAAAATSPNNAEKSARSPKKSRERDKEEDREKRRQKENKKRIRIQLKIQWKLIKIKLN